MISRIIKHVLTTVINLSLQLLLTLSAKTLINFSKSNIIKFGGQLGLYSYEGLILRTGQPARLHHKTIQQFLKEIIRQNEENEPICDCNDKIRREKAILKDFGIILLSHTLQLLSETVLLETLLLTTCFWRP